MVLGQDVVLVVVGQEVVAWGLQGVEHLLILKEDKFRVRAKQNTWVS